MAIYYNVSMDFIYKIGESNPFDLNPQVFLNSDLDPNTSQNSTDGDGMGKSYYYNGDIDQLKKPWVREPHFIPLVIVYAIFFVVGITGNILVIAVLCWGRAGSCVTFPCLVSMAWADVLFLLICLPHAVLTHFISHWTLSDFLCKLSGFVENLSANATVLNLILISMERYFVIAHPLSSKTLCTSKTARLALACTWVASLLLACPAFVVMGTEANTFFNNTTSVVIVMCADIGVDSHDQMVYAVWKLASLFVIPTCILLFCYIKVICILWLSTRQLQTMTSHSR
ncbi:unnamed protein product [Lymnaea stagnalis]|uniref:G-protein coupled receptors family 1 profile domain-containing protein n=1 Tax=Lymnaea stagnalis TaxID=6523 RepID=A0AAV2H043_LYMST